MHQQQQYERAMKAQLNFDTTEKSHNKALNMRNAYSSMLHQEARSKIRDLIKERIGENR